MGQDIHRMHFSVDDEGRFMDRLVAETDYLGRCLRQGQFSELSGLAGYEQEAWLVDRNGAPAPRNSEFLAAVEDPDVVSELSRFNFEINGTPQRLIGHALSQQEVDLQRRWDACQAIAGQMDLRAIMIGILPSIEERDLCLGNISRNNRYHALNARLQRERKGRPLQLHIEGRETLSLSHDDIMLEAGTTSYQIHHQLAASEAVRGYNAALLLAAPMVAASANAPFLFGRDLWEETRIPLFEGAVDLPDCGSDTKTAPCRVFFGSGYLCESFLETFEENLLHYPPLLPLDLHTPIERMSHLTLHNGTIWRWIRPIIGHAGDQYTFRIEHRVTAAGPSVVDEVANAAFLHGLLRACLDQRVAVETRLPFEAARRNFYLAARYGLNAHLEWLDGMACTAQDLILQTLLPLARQGLDTLGVAAADSDKYLGIIEARISSGRTGSAWQRAFVDRYGRHFNALVVAYAERSDANVPVHVWDL